MPFLLFLQGHEFLEDLKENHEPILNVTFLTLTCVVAFIGILGNIAMIMTYLKKNRQSRFNIMMIFLSILDGIYLTLDVAWNYFRFDEKVYWLDWDFSFREKYSILEYFMIATFGSSVFTTLFVSIDRYFAFCRERFVTFLPILHLLLVNLDHFWSHLITFSHFSHF